MTEAALVRGWVGVLALGCAALASSAHAESAPAGQALHLLVGSQREIHLGKPLERIAIGNPEVADALLLKGRGTSTSLLIVAKKPGAASIMVWTQGGTAMTYNIQVDAAVSLPGDPTVNVQGNAVVVSGQAKDVYALARARRAAAATAAAISEKGGDGSTAAGTGTAKDGSSTTGTWKTKAGSSTGSEKGADGYVVDTTVLGVPGTVQVDVRVVEFSKTVLKQVGFSLNSGFKFGTTSGGISSGSSGNPVSAAFNLLANWSHSWAHWNLGATLGLMESNGMARVLAEPSLVALSGQSANFLAGGEIPIPVPQALGATTIEYKPFGIGLTVSPTILSENRIALKVAPEASDLDFSRGITLNGATVPAIVTRRADTTVELGDGESFIIGGLVSRSTQSNLNKVPFLADLPVIGTFFKQLNYNQDERELVIIVTPHLVRPMARNAPIDQMLPGQVNGQDLDRPDAPVWGPFTLGIADSAIMPGFSR